MTESEYNALADAYLERIGEPLYADADWISPLWEACAAAVDADPTRPEGFDDARAETIARTADTVAVITYGRRSIAAVSLDLTDSADTVDALEILSSIDEGEYVDDDRLRELAETIRAQVPADELEHASEGVALAAIPPATATFARELDQPEQAPELEHSASRRAEILEAEAPELVAPLNVQLERIGERLHAANMTTPELISYVEGNSPGAGFGLYLAELEARADKHVRPMGTPELVNLRNDADADSAFRTAAHNELARRDDNELPRMTLDYGDGCRVQFRLSAGGRVEGRYLPGRLSMTSPTKFDVRERDDDDDPERRALLEAIATVLRTYGAQEGGPDT